jgi:predicted nucleic acid-binding protein
MNNIIISDTSCLIALSNIGKLHILKDLYQEVTITNEVQNEFAEPLPGWIIVKNVINRKQQALLEKLLDKGEASSIALAIENQDSILIIDEMKGRKVALSYHLDIIGTIGVIVTARKKGIITDLMSVIFELIHEGFRVSDRLLKRLKEEFGEP